MARGLRVGLFGGSFDPPHRGHSHLATTAMRRLALDRVIWLVSPQNPLKLNPATASLDQRLTTTRRWARGRSMIVSDFETRIDARYTIDTVRRLKARFPAVKFVWLMGADNLAHFHRWRGWVEIMMEIPVAVVARPGALLSSRFSPAARRFAHARIRSTSAERLPGAATPAWTYLRAPLEPTSSTALRTGRSHPYPSSEPDGTSSTLPLLRP